MGKGGGQIRGKGEMEGGVTDGGRAWKRDGLVCYKDSEYLLQSSLT